MRAILMAGGKGTRLYPYTAVFPKPLVPVGERPILEIIIYQLKYYGFKDITLCVGHLASLVETYFGDGHKLGVKINYSLEDKPLGTIAPLTLLDHLPENFLVANGDLLVDFDIKKFWEYHKKSKALLSIGTYKRHEKIELGVLDEELGKVVAYREKPEFNFMVSAGIYILNKKILEYVPKNEYFDFPSLVQSLLNDKKNINAYNIEGFWLDIGRADDYQKAIEEFASKENIFSKYFYQEKS